MAFLGYDPTKPNDKENQNSFVHFFLDDYKFEVIQSDPEPRPEKLSQTKESYHRNPGPTTQYQLSLQIYNTFCSRWRGAYLQSKG